MYSMSERCEFCCTWNLSACIGMTASVFYVMFCVAIVTTDQCAVVVVRCALLFTIELLRLVVLATQVLNNFS